MGSTGAVAYGLVDEPAHLATCAVALLAVVAIAGRRAVPPPSSPRRLLASVAIDIDHIPGYLGSHGLTGALPRAIHAQPAAGRLLLAALGLVAARQAAGISRSASPSASPPISVRDLATGPGVPLLWPLSDAAITVPYAVYAGSLMAAVLVAARRPHSERGGSQRRRSNPQSIPISPPHATR